MTTKQKVLGVTGHRPALTGGYQRPAQRRLERFATDCLASLKPDKVITGMAQGWDQAIAFGCLTLEIPFVAAVPFEGQEDKWPYEARHNYHILLGHAEEQVMVNFGPYHASKMMERNLWIVDNSTELLALWNGDCHGGTYNAVKSAQEIELPITNVWDAWCIYNPR